jgi:hypothetical protein
MTSRGTIKKPSIKNLVDNVNWSFHQGLCKALFCLLNFQNKVEERDPSNYENAEVSLVLWCVKFHATKALDISLQVKVQMTKVGISHKKVSTSPSHLNPASPGGWHTLSRKEE